MALFVCQRIEGGGSGGGGGEGGWELECNLVCVWMCSEVKIAEVGVAPMSSARRYSAT